MSSIIAPLIAPFPITPLPHAAPINAAIARMYLSSGLPLPTPEFPIVPLYPLLENNNLNLTELADLSRAHAMRWLLQNNGLAQPWPLSQECEHSLAGFLYANSAGGIVFVEARNPISRRRFSAAHELGHYLLHYLPYAQHQSDEIEWRDPVQNAAASTCSTPEIPTLHENINIAERLDYAQIEGEANAFAAQLLMPENVVNALAAPARAQWGDADLVWRLSQTLLVSRMAMFVRLRFLGWIDGTVSYDAIESHAAKSRV